MAINIQKLVDAINAKNLSSPARSATALTEPVGEAADVFVGGIAITEYDLDTIPAGTTVTYDNSRWLATDFTANPAGNTSGDDITLGTWPSSETAAVVIDFNNTYIEMNNIVYSSSIKIAFSILRGANNVTIKNLNLKIKGTSATWTGIHASDAYGNATATVTFENCVFDLSEWVKGASPGAYPNSYVYLNGQSLVFDADCIVIKSPSHGDVFSPYINVGTIDATNATVYTSTDAEAIALLPLSKSLTGNSLGSTAERLTINKLISNVNSAYDIYTIVDSVSDLPESTAANHGLLTYIRGSDAFYVSNAFIGWEPLSIGGAGAVVPYGVVYPLSSTTADPTNTTWRTTYGTPVGYQWVADFGMVTTSPLTNMTGMFEGNTSFSDPDIATWDVSTVTNMSSVFKDASNFGSEVALTQTIDNPNAYGTSAGDGFGHGMASSSTYTIVGAYNEDDASGTDSGKAYIFNNATGALLHTLNNPNPYGTSAGDRFAFRVAISETYAIVGAFGEDDAGGTSSGKAYIYNNATGALLHTLTNPNAYGTSADDHFGWTVAITDTYAIVGAYQEDEGINDISSGKAYMFQNSTGTLYRTINNPNAYGTAANDRFGRRVKATANYIIVGADGEADASAGAGYQSGKAYVYNSNGSSLLNTITNPNPYGTSANDQFGLVAAADATSDYFVISARAEDDAGGTESGKVYIYSGTGTLLHTLDNPNAYGTSQTDYFGAGLAINSQYTAVNAWQEDDAGGTGSGKVYIFNTVTGALLHTLDNPNPYGTSQNDSFGYEGLSLNGTTLFVGAYGEDDAGGSGSGKVYVYDLTPPASWSISGWNTTSVTDMSSMFQNASVFDQDLSSWNVLNASVAPGNSTPPTDFDTNATAWVLSRPIWGSDGTSILYPLTNTATDPTSANWRTANPTYQFIANVGIVMPAGSPITSMLEMFKSTTLNDPDISTWDVSTVTDMSSMFFNADVFNQPLSSWDVSNVTNMQSMFGYTDAFNQDISSWDVSSVINMIQMFEAATAFNNGGVALNWGTGTANVTSMNRMFYGATGATVFNQDISSWDVSSVTDMLDMFSSAAAFDQDISSWNVLAASVAPGNSTPPSNFDLNTNVNWTTVEKPVWGTIGVITYPLSNTATDPTSATWRNANPTYTWIANVGIRMPGGSPITSMVQLFSLNTTFNDPDIATWDVSTVTHMSSMFTSNLAFNQNISSWDVSSVTNMASMFNNADAFNQDISSWNVSSVTDMNNMFDNADQFGQNISSWNVNNVTTATGFSLNAAQKGTQWLVSEHPSNVGLGNFYSL